MSGSCAGASVTVVRARVLLSGGGLSFVVFGQSRVVEGSDGAFLVGGDGCADFVVEQVERAEPFLGVGYGLDPNESVAVSVRESREGLEFEFGVG